MYCKYKTPADAFFDSKYKVGEGLANRFGLSPTIAICETFDEIIKNNSAINEILQNFDVLYTIFKSPTTTAKFYTSPAVLNALITNETFRKWTFANEEVSAIISQNDLAVKTLLCHATGLDHTNYHDVRDLTSDETAITAIANNALASYFLSKMPEIFRIAIETDLSIEILASKQHSREAISNSQRCMYILNENDRQTMRWVMPGTTSYVLGEKYTTITAFRDGNDYLNIDDVASKPNVLYRAIRSPRFMYYISGRFEVMTRLLCIASGQAVITPSLETAIHPSRADVWAAETALNIMFNSTNKAQTIQILKNASGGEGLMRWAEAAADRPLRQLICACIGLNYFEFDTFALLRQNPQAALAISNSKDALEILMKINRTERVYIINQISYPTTYANIPRSIPYLTSNNHFGYKISGNIITNYDRLTSAGTRPETLYEIFGGTNTQNYVHINEQYELYNLGYEKLNIILEVPETNLIQPTLFTRDYGDNVGPRINTVWGSTNGYSWHQLADTYINAYHFGYDHDCTTRLDCPEPIRYFKFEWVCDGQHLRDRGWMLSNAQ